MVWVKKFTIFSSVFFSKIGLEIMLRYGLERKEAFEDDKSVNFLKSQKWVFSKGVKVTRPSFFGGVPPYFEALWYPHLYFYRKSNT